MIYLWTVRTNGHVVQQFPVPNGLGTSGKLVQLHRHHREAEASSVLSNSEKTEDLESSGLEDALVVCQILDANLSGTYM